MLSKSLLQYAIPELYKSMVLSDDCNQGLKAEILSLAHNSSLFSSTEIADNKQKINEVNYIASHCCFDCFTDGAVSVTYDDVENKEGKHIKAGGGFIIKHNDQTIFSNYFAIPNQYAEKDVNSHLAEYQAFISCLRTLSIWHPDTSFVSVTVYSDSENLVNQLNRRRRVRNETQRQLFSEAIQETKKFKDVKIVYIPREQNTDADSLAQKSILYKKWTS